MPNTAIDTDEWNPEWDETGVPDDISAEHAAELAADAILERQEFEDFEQADEYFGGCGNDNFGE